MFVRLLSPVAGLVAVMTDVTVSDTVKLQSPRQVLGTWLIDNSTWSSQLMWKIKNA